MPLKRKAGICVFHVQSAVDLTAKHEKDEGAPSRGVGSPVNSNGMLICWRVGVAVELANDFRKAIGSAWKSNNTVGSGTRLYRFFDALLHTETVLTRVQVNAVCNALLHVPAASPFPGLPFVSLGITLSEKSTCFTP